MSEAEQAPEMEQTPVETPVETPKEINTYIDFNKFEDVTAEQVKARIDKDSREKRTAERKLQEAQRQIREQEEKIIQSQKPLEVQAPSADLALMDEEEFKRKTQEFTAKTQELATWNAQQTARQDQLKAESERESQSRRDSFVARGSEAGLNIQTIQAAATIVAPQLQDEVAQFVLDHEFGPQILNQLAANPMEVQELASLGSIQAGVKLNDMAQVYRKKLTTNAPPPDDPLTGSGAPSDKRGPKGAKFE